MNDNDRYLFDLQGFLTIENAIDEAHLHELNRVLDDRIAAECNPEMKTHRFGHLLRWGRPFTDLIDNPVVSPILAEVLDPRFRLDHTYLDVIRAGPGPIGVSLHSGGAPFNPGMYYRYDNGHMHSGLTVVAYNLADVGEDDGGFGCVPGSHKANLPFPTEWQNTEHGRHPCAVSVPGPAGSAVVFTEALTHGTLPWVGATERRTIFFKYSPHVVSWSATYLDEEAPSGLTERQLDILEAPNARDWAREARRRP